MDFFASILTNLSNLRSAEDCFPYGCRSLQGMFFSKSAGQHQFPQPWVAAGQVNAHRGEASRWSGKLKAEIDHLGRSTYE